MCHGYGLFCRYNTDVNFTLYYNDYVALYHDTIQPIVESEDSTHPFIMSSPSNGLESLQEGYVAKQPWSELYGDSMYPWPLEFSSYTWVLFSTFSVLLSW